MDDSYVAESSPKIDYEKSIKKQRLIYEITGWGIFNNIFNYFLLFIFAGLAASPILAIIQGAATPIWLMGCSVLILAWIIANVLLKNALVKIEVKSIAQNKENITATMDDFFSSYDFKINNEQIMRSFTATGNGDSIWGKIITILFDGNIIYLNITTLGKTNSPTMIHGLSNFLKARRIARYFKEKYVKN